MELATQPRIAEPAVGAVDILFENATVGLAFMDRDLRFVRVNPRLAEINNTPAVLHIGRRLSDLFPAAADEAESYMRQTLERNEAVVGVEIVVTLPDEGPRSFICDYHPMPLDADGRPTGIACVVTEQTERLAAAARIAESETRLRHVLDAVSAFAAILDPNGVLLEANAPALAAANLNPADVRDRPFHETYWMGWHPDTAARAFDAVARARAGEIVRYRDRCRIGPERQLTVDIQIAPVRDALGQVTMLVASGIDVTDLADAQERQELLTAELNHRVKNILAVVRALVSQTARRVNTKEALAQALEGRIAAMAKAVALLSRSQWGGFGLADVLHEQFETQGSDRFRLNGPNIPVAPKAALSFALIAYELVTNAAKYGALSKPDGYVAIDWEVFDNELSWSWKEIGGPPAKTPEETGFGSLLIRNLAEGDLGADVSTDYTPDGLRFMLRAALKRVQGPAPREQFETPRPTQLLGRRILVVEDSAIIALDIASTLEAAGAVIVGPAGTVDDALKLAETEHYDAAILDIDLGGKPSWPVREAIAARDIPVLTVAAQVRDGAGMPSGLMLAKPFTEQELLASLAKLFAPAG